MSFQMRRAILAVAATAAAIAAPVAGQPWPRHAIDASSRGADGVRLHDVNGDGRRDIATGWEEGGTVRVYLHPGLAAVTRSWPAVRVGSVRSPEDAVFADLDGDGAVDVVSSCEGRTRSLFVHWAPADRERYLDPHAWTTELLPASRDQTAWMFCLPLDVDGDGRVDLVTGSKGDDARVVWWKAPQTPRDLAAWQDHPMTGAGWIMSLVASDVDGDGDADIVVSDRKGRQRGCWWLENPLRPHGVTPNPWKRHPIGGLNQEVMFMSAADLDGDGREDWLAAVRRGNLLWFRRRAGAEPSWDEIAIAMPPDTGGGKGVAVGDINGDGRQDVVFSCEGAEGRHGVMWLSCDGEAPGESSTWNAHPVSGREEGVKFDIVELVDFDEDGDLDVLTCEERDNLGVIWYENLHIKAHRPNASPRP